MVNILKKEFQTKVTLIFPETAVINTVLKNNKLLLAAGIFALEKKL